MSAPKQWCNEHSTYRRNEPFTQADVFGKSDMVNPVLITGSGSNRVTRTLANDIRVIDSSFMGLDVGSGIERFRQDHGFIV